MDPAIYRDPALYDILHAPGTEAEVDGLLQLAQRFRPGARRWLEPACGTGRLLCELSRRGQLATGFDLNPAMVQFARARGEGLRPGPRVFVADMTDFAAQIDPGPIDVAINPINTIRHLPTDADVLTHLDQIRQVLADDGVYAVGISLSDYLHDVPTEDIWEGTRDGRHVRQVVQYVPPAAAGPRHRFEEVISHVVVDDAAGRSHLDDRYRLRTYDEAEWSDLIERSALRRIAVVDELGRDLTTDADVYGIHVLRKR